MYVNAIVVIVMIAAVIIDIREHRIPNILSFFLVLFGLLYNLFDDVYMFVDSLKAVIGVFIIFLIPYNMGILGAGDIKIMMGLASVYRLTSMWSIIMYILIAGTLFSAIHLLAKGRLKSSVKRIVGDLYQLIQTGQFTQFKIKNKTVNTDTALPYSIAIASGYAVFILKEIIGVS